MKKVFLSALCALPLWCLADGLPDLGDVSQALISPQQERSLGEEAMMEIRADDSYLDDAEVNDYLNRIGYRLASNSSEPGMGFEFFAINDNAINAFSLPGGFVGVNTGLILLTQSESELASVLGHEISHATQHHVIRMIVGSKVDSLAQMIAMAVAILAARSNPDVAQAAIVGAQAGSIQRQLAFSRENEEEADRLGLTLMQNSGFDAHAMPVFLARMQSATRIVDGNLPSYLLTHPVTKARVADIANRVQQIPFKQVEDSLSFHLVRAKLIVAQRAPQDAVTFFTDQIETRKGNPTAQRYGLALALLRARRPADAAQTFAPLQNLVPRNPMIATLSGQIRHANKEPGRDLIAFYRNAVQNFPDHRALIYDYANLLLQNGQQADALKMLNAQLIAHPGDPNLYDLQAQSYAAMGDPQSEHHALAHAYAAMGYLRSAIDQLRLAKQSGSDFYQLSAIESELKKLRALDEAREKEAQR